MSTASLQQRLNDLFAHIRQGKIVEAIQEFYGQDTKMQDNANPPTVGQAANIAREKEFLKGVKEWRGFNVTASAVGDNVTFYEATLDFIATNGQPVHMEQVSVAKWKNGKIVHERFYYDTGKVASLARSDESGVAGASAFRLPCSLPRKREQRQRPMGWSCLKADLHHLQDPTRDLTSPSMSIQLNNRMSDGLFLELTSQALAHVGTYAAPSRSPAHRLVSVNGFVH